ncbi:MAG: magnesium chelatase domain-containing protein, partial [Gammaproteobacteria bacterium]
MVGIALTYTTLGIDALQVSVECDRTGSMQFNVNIVGMPSNSVKESKDRVFAALRNSNISHQTSRYTINLAPADIKKDSSALDLPIALSVIMNNGQIPEPQLTKIAVVGELSLDGNVRPVDGVLPIAIAAKRDGVDILIVPQENAEEAAIIEDITVIPVTSLAETVNYLCGKAQILPAKVDRDKIFQVLNDFPL